MKTKSLSTGVYLLVVNAVGFLTSTDSSNEPESQLFL